MAKYAMGNLTPKLGKVDQIAKALGVEPDDLVPGYVTRSTHQHFGVRMVEFDSGNIWLEYSGAFDPEIAKQILALIAKVKSGDGPARDA